MKRLSRNKRTLIVENKQHMPSGEIAAMFGIPLEVVEKVIAETGTPSIQKERGRQQNE